jgi:ribosomal protein L11 methyltransferase
LALQKWLRFGDKILDIGCGSGILSVVGLLLGADFVFACDIDPAGAVPATLKNAELNSIDMSRLSVCHGDVLSDEGLRSGIADYRYDMVMANIVADVIIDLADFVPIVLKAGGYFIASGVIDERVPEVIAALNAKGFVIIDELEQEGWHCIVGQKNA